MVKHILLFVFFGFFGVVSMVRAQEVGAPFGLTWGASADAVGQALGVVPDPEPLWGRLNSFTSSKAPITPPDTDMILAAVDPEHGLGRVIWISTTIEDDPFGSEGRGRYNALQQVLTEKYGKPSRKTEETGAKLWKDRDEFYECLDYQGCGLWMSLWEVGTPPVLIGLRIKGVRRGTGYVVITYEGPNWDAILDAVKAGEAKAKKDAF